MSNKNTDIKYIENVNDYGEMSDDDISDTSIDEDFYKSYIKAYKYAMDMTIKEVHQAAEGLFHNLNTLQSRSGN